MFRSTVAPLGHRNKILRQIMILKNPLWQSLVQDDLQNILKPIEFCCPILHELMEDPVVAADGHTYERKAIEKWIYEGNPTSPMTNDILDNKILLPNINLRCLIHKFANYIS